MKLFKAIGILLIALSLNSCEDVVDVNIASENHVLVVEGSLTNLRENQYVKLYYTNPVLSDGSYEVVTKAILTLKDNLKNVEILKESSPGWYQISTIKGREGRTYTLNIKTTDGTYEAISTMPRLTMTPDTVQFKYEMKSIVYPDEGYYPVINGRELEGIGDFSQFKIFKNNKFLNKANEINLFKDEYVDGNYISNYELDIDSAFVSGDLIRVEAWSLTKENYVFWDDIQTQLNNSGIFATPLPNAHSNIFKITQESKDVTGFFGTSMVKSVQKLIP
ncbi:hypothetical protein ADIARSV_0189 [Arcticibacter svalbardensis MN12-7]|uniref:DUF4249 domain-containing protein n=1 Tax=Arcticibacter svalbardensis MN12-7 TaxID=1150600 RepID=R9GY14_9SPHI|nr:DUF4249 family protein [Arcticibacter svalbardensis]EOR96558.1 hypothetical protein ADIARSV_0189 [Arcticibacter svalbardensis MN12-7]